MTNGVFPEPLRNGKNSPYYTADMIDRCRQIMAAGIGLNGEEIAFRPKDVPATQRPKRDRPRPTKASGARPGESAGTPLARKVLGQLPAFGIRDATAETIESAIAQAYPDGAPSPGDALRAIVQALGSVGRQAKESEG